MGRKARVKRERQEGAPENEERSKRGRAAGRGRGARGASGAKGGPRRRLLFITLGLLVAAAGVAVVIALLPQGGATPAPAAGDSADSLAAAAEAIHFHPNITPDVGQIEEKAASDEQPPMNPHLLALGIEAPDFDLASPSGVRHRLSDFRGKAVLLEFFATWCPHCQAEAPHLVRLAARLPADRYAFLAVNADGEDAASIEAFDRYFGISYPTLLDPSGRQGSFYAQGDAGATTRLYNVEVYPTFYVIDKMGRIQWRSDREQPDALIEEQLKLAAGK